jgi:hypothetical protein
MRKSDLFFGHVEYIGPMKVVGIPELSMICIVKDGKRIVKVDMEDYSFEKFAEYTNKIRDAYEKENR